LSLTPEEEGREKASNGFNGQSAKINCPCCAC